MIRSWVTRGDLRTAGPRLARALAVFAAGLEFAASATAGTPWDRYNAGVEAYAGQRYAEAEQAWQDLTLEPLPRSLRPPVWFQIGNAEFRLGEPLESSAPEQTVDFWRRSREAYRTVLANSPRHAAARQNLRLVDRRLAKLVQRLGNALRDQAEQRPLDDALNDLRAGVEFLREAHQLEPGDAVIREDRTKAERRLQERLLERATQAETRGDQSAAQNNLYGDGQAEQAYRDALADLDEGRREGRADTGVNPDLGTPAAPLERTLAEAQDRVQHKLADLLTRMGQHEQKSGEQQMQYNPDQALMDFDAAREHFEAAQAAEPNHAAARQGEREVKAAMEQLHLREGRQKMTRGVQAIPQNAPVAARELTAALSHFEAALAVNPLNAEAESRAAEARKLLPDVLARVGQEEQRAGDQAEPQSPGGALAHFEEAQSAFQGALELAPQHAEARRGLEAVEERLARLRHRLVEEAAQAGQDRPGKRDALQDLLGQVQESQRDANRELERRRQAGRNQPQTRRTYPDW
jgi:hypothetical protein